MEGQLSIEESKEEMGSSHTRIDVDLCNEKNRRLFQNKGSNIEAIWENILRVFGLWAISCKENKDYKTDMFLFHLKSIFLS